MKKNINKSIMNKIVTLIFLFIVSFQIEVYAQDLSVKYAETITAADLRKHLVIIASDEMEGRETTTAGQFRAARFLANEFEKIGLERIVPLGDYKSYFQWFDVGVNNRSQYLKADVGYKNSKNELKSSMNILGLIPGKKYPKEVVVISAHYDHLGIDKNGDINNGADDDGSGTAAILEIAEAFMKSKEDGNGPDRSILFILFAGEEKGLLGSKYFTNYDPVIPIDNIVCDLNIDMIGRMDEKHNTDKYVYLIGADKLSKQLDAISKSINKKYLGYEIDYTYNNESDPNRFYYRSDHYNFAKKNVPVIFFFTGVHEDYHKPSDDIEKILFPKYSKITQYVFHVAWEVANRKKSIELD
jgi:hypothetical protein